MGKHSDGNGAGEHHGHNAGHGEHHESENQKFYLDRQQLDKYPKGHPLNFSQKHPVFDIQLNKVGPQFTQIDDKRLEYVRNFAGKLPLQDFYIPKNIPGLVPKTGPLPSNRRFWKNPSGSFERSGKFLSYTFNFTTRVQYPVFFCFLLYGWWGHITYGWFKFKYLDNEEIPNILYDKIHARKIPQTKLWIRPG